jgi:hypothetical protein
MSNTCGSIIQTINLGLCIAIIVFTTRIYNSTKPELNPIEKYENEHNSTNIRLLNSPPPLSLEDVQIEKHCQCGEQILTNICTEEQIISGCYDITPNNQKHFLRKLDSSFCNVIKMELDNKKYSEVFDLGYVMVSKMALGTLIVYCCILGVIVVLMISLFGVLCCGEGALCILAACAPCIIVIVLFSGITNLVLYIIMLVNFYKGTTTGEYLQYYDECMAETDKNKYYEIYKELSSIHSDMTVFVILNAIGSFFNYLGSCFSKPPENN